MQRLVLIAAATSLAVAAPSYAEDGVPFADWHADAPGVQHRITPADLPAPFATPAVVNIPKLVPRPEGATLVAPRGFDVSVFEDGFTTPRTMRFAPNGDLFVAESQAGRITVLHMDGSTAHPASRSTFASRLDMPFGIAFWPPGPAPQYVYVGSWGSVVRYPYRNGDATARGPAEPVVPHLPTSGHWTRDLAFTRDGTRLFVAVGSLSNDAETMPRRSMEEIRSYEAVHGLGSSWSDEEGRATVLQIDPDGGHPSQYANGLRNCAGLVLQPGGDDIWCTVNERDQLGDDLPSDYVTHVEQGGFYGWPWYYIGAHEDPFHRGEREDLAGKVVVPDVLIQPHSAPLTLTFYEGSQFPAPYRGSIFVALHGSYNRSRRTGYKVVRLLMKDGRPTGTYEDFLTGFVASDEAAWGRPVGVTVAPDGSLLVSDDAGGVIWRVTYREPAEE
jgi:glucose/arabinose dehydrogenase